MLSVCMIVKNAEKTIENSLRALCGYGWEIVVVDTGSTDRTREIAAKYTECLYECPWEDDFALAKNFAVSKASNDAVMVVDSDEFLEKIEKADADLLEQHILLHPDQVGRVRRRNVFPAKDGKRENQEWINRVFSRRQFHYAGRIHEQLISLDGAPYQTFKTPVVLYHTGYDLSPEEKLAKAQRNIRLLERELLELQKRGQTDDAMTEAKEEAEALIPYILYQLGKSYYLSEDYGKACDYFSQGLSYELNPSLEYVIDMVETYGYALINGGRAQEALFFENIYEEFGRSADFQFLMGLIYMNNMRFDDAVHEFQKASCQKECRTIGVNDWLAYYNIGVIHECLGQKEKAAEWYRKCKNYPQEQARLREIRGGNEQGAGQENRS